MVVKQQLLLFCITTYIFWYYFYRTQGGAVVVVFVWWFDLQLPMHTTNEIESSNPANGEVYSIQFVSDLQQVDGFLRVLWFSAPIKLTVTI